MATVTSAYLRRLSEERKAGRRKEAAKVQTVEDSYFPDVSAIDVEAGVLKRSSVNATPKRERAKSASPRYEPATTTRRVSSTFLTQELQRILHDKPAERLKTELEETRAELRDKELRLARAQDEAEVEKMRFARLELERTRELRQFSERENEYREKLVSSSLMEGYWEGFSEGMYAGFVNAPRMFGRRIRSRSAGEADLGAGRSKQRTEYNTSRRPAAAADIIPTSPTTSTMSTRITQPASRPRRRSWLPRPSSSDVSSIVESIISGTTASPIPPVPRIPLPKPKPKRTVTVRSDPEVFDYSAHEDEGTEASQLETPPVTPPQPYIPPPPQPYTLPPPQPYVLPPPRHRPSQEAPRHRSSEDIPRPPPVVVPIPSPEPPIQRASTSSPTPRDRRRRPSTSSQRSTVTYFRDPGEAPPVPDISSVLKSRRQSSQAPATFPSPPRSPSTPSTASTSTLPSSTGRTVSPPPRHMSQYTGSQYSLPGSSIPTIVPSHTPPPSSPQPSIRRDETASMVSRRGSPSQRSVDWRAETSSMMSAEPVFETERQGQRQRQRQHRQSLGPNDSSAKISTSTTLSQMDLLRSSAGTSQWPYEMPGLTNDTSSVTTRAISPSTSQWPFDGSAPGAQNTASDTSTFRVKTPGVVTSDSSQATQRPTRKPRDFELPEPPMAKPLPNLPPPNTPLVYSIPRTVQLDTPTSEDSPGESGSGGVKSPTKLSLKLSKLRQRLLNRSHSTPANELPTIRSRFGKSEGGSPLALGSS